MFRGGESLRFPEADTITVHIAIAVFGLLAMLIRDGFTAWLASSTKTK